MWYVLIFVNTIHNYTLIHNATVLVNVGVLYKRGHFQMIKDKDKDEINTVYCHVASTWNLDVVAYIIHTYIYT